MAHKQSVVLGENVNFVAKLLAEMYLKIITSVPGSNCEIDISVCNTTEKKCNNGGQCIEGLGEAFFCYCPVGKNYTILN
jgi:hypothetical protein